MQEEDISQLEKDPTNLKKQEQVSKLRKELEHTREKLKIVQFKAKYSEEEEAPPKVNLLDYKEFQDNCEDPDYMEQVRKELTNQIIRFEVAKKDVKKP